MPAKAKGTDSSPRRETSHCTGRPKAKSPAPQRMVLGKRMPAQMSGKSSASTSAAGRPGSWTSATT